jgi:hypothetical protein
MPELKPLHDKLLSFGGNFVALEPECDFEKLIKEGQLIKGKVIFKPMEKRKCHSNCANLWHENPKIYQIATGWALSNRSVWLQHTCPLKGKNIIETTVPMTIYYGIILNDFTAYSFWYENH